MDDQIKSKNLKQLTITEYVKGLRYVGKRVVYDGGEAFWVRNEIGSIMRMPPSFLQPPSIKEIKKLFNKYLVLSVSYTCYPDADYPANAWLYICNDKDYNLYKLPSTMRRNVRRGLNELKIKRVEPKDLLRKGVTAFCDTRSRVGLSDGTIDNFKKRFTIFSKCNGHGYIGAWKDSQLVAFLSILEVNGYAEIEGSFSMNKYLKLRPNDTLMFSALRHFLTDKKYKYVTYGLSSIQKKSKENGLHAFKIKVGFEAKPVCRSFILHPILRPFANKTTLSCISAVQKILPNNRMFKKAEGMLIEINKIN